MIQVLPPMEGSTVIDKTPWSNAATISPTSTASASASP